MKKKLINEIPQERIIIKDTPEDIKAFLLMPNGINKNFLYSKYDIKEFTTANIMKQGNDIYLSISLLYIKKVKNTYFLKSKAKQGISFKEGKTNIWFGQSVEQIPYLKEFFDCMNWDFINPKCHSFITKGILDKIFKNKITNTRDILKHYARSVRLDVSTELLYRCVVNKSLDKISFYKYASFAKNPNHFLERCLLGAEIGKFSVNFNHIIDDLINQYKILDKRIDFRWSEKRINEEHNKATKILMELEVNLLEDIKIDYPEIQLTSNFELLDNQKRVFVESKLMNHCIYTNYWNSILSNNYMAFHVKLNDEEATLGVRIRNNKMILDQLYRKNNAAASSEIRQMCEEFIKNNEGLEIKPAISLKVTYNDF